MVPIIVSVNVKGIKSHNCGHYKMRIDVNKPAVILQILAAIYAKKRFEWFFNWICGLAGKVFDTGPERRIFFKLFCGFYFSMKIILEPFIIYALVDSIRTFHSFWG